MNFHLAATKIPDPPPLNWSSVLSLHRLNPFGHNSLMFFKSPATDSFAKCCQQCFILLLSLIIRSRSSLTLDWTAPVLDHLRVSLTDFEGLTVMLVAILMEMLSRFIAGPSADARRTGSCHMNPFISFLGEFRC